MKLLPINQTILYGLGDKFNELLKLFNNSKLPNKIILSGQKGIGKCTLAYHLINFVLSRNEKNSYDTKKFKINSDNKSFKLILNKTHPNFSLIDILHDKKNIDLAQIKDLIKKLNKSCFNSLPRFILIDNIEHLNLNSVNALLKTLEEPNENTFFLLIHNNRKVLPTLISRCLDFRILLSHQKSKEILENLLNSKTDELINEDLINYYFTPGNIYNLILFFQKNKISLKNIKLKDFLSIILNNGYLNKDSFLNYILYDFIEMYLVKKNFEKNSNFYSYFIKQFDNTKKFNLSSETTLYEFESKILNG